MKLRFGMVLFALAAGAALSVGAIDVDDVSDAKTPVPGQWNSNFQTSINYAESHNLPAMTFYGSTACPHCDTLIEAMRTELFRNWVLEHPIVLIYKHGTPGQLINDADFTAADEWICSFKKNLNHYPFVNFFWQPGGGGQIAVSFSGRDREMPRKTPAGDSVECIAQQLVSSLDLYFGDYVGGPRFACGDAELDRMEATSSTSSMYVPVSAGAQGGTLKVISPSGAASTYPVSASATEVRITVPYGSSGQKTTLELYGIDGSLSDTTHITHVGVRGSSIVYPKWVGESFDYGEWTMDYAAAKAKGGYVLAMFTGTLWCPFCHGAETSLLADPRFTQWAKANLVSLVSFDQGNSSSPATAAGNGKARLLTWEAGESHIVTGEKPSGAYYLSSKGISRSAAEARIALTTKYTSEWLAPGSTSARLGNPTFLLLKNDRVVGRFAGFRDGFVYDVAENLARLNDLLKLAARDDESSDYIQTTGDVLALGGTADVSFQVNSASKCFRLSGTDTCYAGFALTNATVATPVRLEVVTAAKVLASGTNSVIARVSAAQFEAGVWLRATAVYPSGKLGGSSVFTAQVASSAEESGSGGDEDGPGFDPDGRPCLGWEEYELDAYLGFGAANSFNVCNAEGAKSVSIRKVSGALPSGVSLKYDKKSGRVILSGTPKKAGTYTVAYTVSAKIGTKTLTGIPSTFTFTVADPAKLNPFLGKAFSGVDVPLYTAIPGGVPKLAAVLTVSITKANKVTAKYQGTESKAASFSGAWSGIDGVTRAATMSAAVKNGPSLELSMSAAGVLSAEVSGLVGYSHFVEDEEDSLVGEKALPSGASAAFTDYVGVYTVTLPDTDGDDPVGTGFLTLKLTKSAAKTGKVTWSGYLHDGTKISGNSFLSKTDENHASLVIFKRSGNNVFGAELLVTANGAETWDDDEGGNEIVVAKSAPAYMLHREKNLTYERTLNVYGGYLPTDLGPKGVCDALGLDGELGMTLGGEPIAEVTATSKGFSFTKDVLTSLSYAKSTGIFSGKAKLTIDGKAVTGTVRGVLLVNWISCGCGDESIDRPYGSGAFYYTATEDGRKVTRSVPLDLNASPAE